MLELIHRLYEKSHCPFSKAVVPEKDCVGCLTYTSQLWDARESLLKIRAWLGRNVTHIDTNKTEKEKKNWHGRDYLLSNIKLRKTEAGRLNKS